MQDDERRLTKAERRDEARAKRKALEEETARKQKRGRLLMIGGVVVAVAVVIAVVVLAAGSGGGSKGTTPNTSAKTTEVSAQVNSLLTGIPQSGNTLGDPSAPVTLQYYGDLECPFCREFTESVLPTLIQKYVKTGKVKIEYHSLETATKEPSIFTEQQAAALAAGKQNKLWHYVELFYHQQQEEDSGYVTPTFLMGLAHEVPGLNVAAWETARKEPAASAQVQSEVASAAENKLTSTPSFLISKAGGTPKPVEISSVTDPGSFESAINNALA